MPPRESDVAVARALAERIVAAGMGRVRRVGIVGSRANGTAGPASDLDLVVLVETPGDAPRWSAAQVLAEKHRLMAAVGPPPLHTDLWVRTTDQFAEACGVRGCMEHVLATTGVDVCSRPWSRSAVVRRSPRDVRCQNVADWLADAWDELQRAEMLASRTGDGNAAVRFGAGDVTSDVGHHAWRSIQRSLVALFVWHQAPLPTKHQPASETLAALARLEAATARAIRTHVAPDPHSPAAALAVYAIVRRRLAREKSLRPFIARAAECAPS